MAFGLIASLVLLAISTGINLLLRPRIKRAKAPELETIKADEGVPIPLGYGTFVVAPNVVWLGDITLTPSPVGSTYYAANMVMTLALGAIDELVGIVVGGKSLAFEPVIAAQGGPAGAEQVIVPSLPYVRPGSADTPATFSIQAAQMFGGREREGGIRGTMRFYWGGLNQPADPITTAYMTDAGLSGGTGRPGVCYAVFGFEGPHPFYWGTVPQIKDITFILRHSPTALGVGMLGRDANLAEIVYDLKHNNLRGLGLNTTLSDTANYTDVADTILEEGLGLSPVFTTQDEVDDMLDDLHKHAMSVERISPITGKFELKLARNDYTPSQLPRITNALRGASYGNAKNLELSKPNYRETTNDITITYRRFQTGPVGAVFRQVLTAGITYTLTKTPGRYLSTGAQNITLVTLYDDNDVMPTSSYNYVPETGIVLVYGPLVNPSAPAVGSVITIDYTAGPVFSGYKEATARYQDLASIQQSGELRPWAGDYPFFTNDLTAGTHVARLGQQMSRSLWAAKWTMDRTGYGLAPGDVVAINYRPLTEDGNQFAILDDVPFRVTEVDYGLLEDGTITVQAIEDVFAEDVQVILPQPSSGTSSTTPAPAIAIGYAPTSATRIALFPSDTNFQIELWRASVEPGTGQVTGADLVTTLPGTTTSYDDSFPVAGRTMAQTSRALLGREIGRDVARSSLYAGTQRHTSSRLGGRLGVGASRVLMPPGDSVVLGTTYWYAARLVPGPAQRGFTAGPLSAWQSMTATAGTPGAVLCTIPSVTYATSDDGSLGTLTFTVTDPQRRVILVEFQTQAGLAPQSDWTTGTRVVPSRALALGRAVPALRSASRFYNGSLHRSAVQRWAGRGSSASQLIMPASNADAPYVATVDTTPASPSSIGYRISYLDCAGTVVSNLTGTVSFP